MSRTNGKNVAHLLENQSSEAFVVLELVVYRKSIGSRCEIYDRKDSLKDNFKPHFLSQLSTPGQLLGSGLNFLIVEASLPYSNVGKRVSFEA